MKRNAIIMAAGLSSRLVPLSLETPKALLKVKGEVLIERQINQLKEAGIQEIVVVTGYLKEQFSYLKDKYNVTIIENPDYRKMNNYSSLYAARDYLKDTYICCGDIYYPENVFIDDDLSNKSYYAVTFQEGNTKEWCIIADKEGRIEDVTIGGKDSLVMAGHAHFDLDFSSKMKSFLEVAYGREEYVNAFWEDIYIEHINELDMFYKEYSNNSIVELDSFAELREFDPNFEEHSGSKILENISLKLNCKEREIVDIKPIKNDNIVIGFTFKFNNKTYAYSISDKKLTI